MTKQIVWPFRKFFFLQFDTKFASITKISQDWHHFVIVVVDPDFASMTYHARDENAECDMHGLERPLRVSATQCL